MDQQTANEIDALVGVKLGTVFYWIMTELMENLTPQEVEDFLRNSGDSIADRFKEWWGEY